MMTPGVASIVDRPTSTTDDRDARPSLYILSDVRLLCEGLTLALDRDSSVRVVGASDPMTSAAAIAALQPDVLLLDVAMPGAIEAARPLRRLLPLVKIIAIAVAEAEEELIDCVEAGLSGFVSRQGSAQDVVSAVHCAVRGELSCSPRAAALVFNKLATLAAQRSPDPVNGVLTPREQEIVVLVGEGLSNKEIARRLRIGNPTVKNHIHSILGKLHLRRRSEVAARLHHAAPLSASRDARSGTQPRT